MTFYYLLFVGCNFMSMISTYMFKKFQLTAGVGLFATCVYLVINGVVSAAAPVFVMLFTRQRIELTMYSFIMALAIVLSSAVSTVGTFKAYEKGQMAVVTVFSTIGSIVISCAWGSIFLKEEITVGQGIGILLMIVSVLVVIIQKNVEIRRDILWLMILIAVLSGIGSIVNKMHQVEVNYKTVDTLNYSMWVGIVRVIVFFPLLFVSGKKVTEKVKLSKTAIVSAILASVITGTTYILSLVTARVLPLTITSPLGTALSVFLTTVMAWIVYHEKLSKQQIAGLILCLAGVFVFAWS